MPSLVLAAGRLRVTYPDSYRVAQQRPGGADQGDERASGSVWAGPVGPTDEISATLLEAFAAQSLELVEPFELVPAQSPSEGPGHDVAPWEKIQVSLELPESQDAVILLEEDGLLSWHLPIARDSAPTPPPGPSRTMQQPAQSRGGPPGRVVRFEIEVGPGAPVQPSDVIPAARHTPTHGLSRDVVLGRVARVGRLKAYVLRFVSQIVPGALLHLLERDTHPGLVLMNGTEVQDWPQVQDLTLVSLPESRPAKILLFVHGTFSSTVGSFGILTSTPQGQQLLRSAADSYDAVLGFDHRTLSQDPLENAIDLLARLEARHLAFAPTLDIVSYSRGALVARSLVEYLLPSSLWRADLGKIVFVAGTNAGTALAEPENWRLLLDLHTTLTAATARSVGFATKTAPSGKIVGGLVTGIGAFVKYLASASGSALSPAGPPSAGLSVPGLAAMEPDGPFIAGINGAQPGQPAPGTPWHVVSSDFEVNLLDDRHEPPELPRELVALLADGLVDRLMGAMNDLVVPTASMSAVDLPSGGGFIEDSLSFGTNGVVHHLNYFIQPRVCDALRTWLTYR